MPTASDAIEICEARSTSSELCSMSMNSQSKSQVFATVAMSTVRDCRTPMPSVTSPAARRRLVWFGVSMFCSSEGI
ncbi:hypothetical protein D3C83_33250 [compost metagenome]